MQKSANRVDAKIARTKFTCVNSHMENSMFVSIQINGRCEKCGSEISTDTLMHGWLGMPGPMCNGKIAGRKTVSVWITESHTIRRTGEVVPSPWRGHKASVAERQQVATLIADVRRTGKSLHNHPVSA